MEVDNLYEKYCASRRREVFSALCLTLITVGSVYVILHGLYLQDPSVRSVTQLSVCGIVTFLVLLITVFTYIISDSLFKRFSLAITLTLWAILVSALYTHNAVQDDRTAASGMALMYVFIFVLYTSLPVTTRTAILIGLASGLVHLILPSVLANIHKDTIGLQISTNAVILLCANITGLYYKHLTTSSIRQTFTDTRLCIEARIKLEHERQQQEQLLLSVMPVHLAVEMKNKMLEKLQSPQGARNSSFYRKKSSYSKFHEMYVKVNENVSILYADIVNFTPLAAECTAAELVRVLNELFGKFDKLAQENDCMRIKILGDCYYCVSGLPVSRPGHAKNCVNMGLQMIQAIREVRNATEVDVDMRIGVHTGAVLSGVLGLRKWQYDVWSDDVTLANYMESGGVPGRVHISQSTLNHLGDEFKIEAGNGAERSSYIRKRNLETYLIIAADTQEQCSSKVSNHWLEGAPMRSMSKYLASWGADRPFANLMDTTLANNIGETSVAMMESSISSPTCLSHPRTWFQPCDIHSVTLTLPSWSREWACLTQPDTAFKHYVICADILLICILLINVLMMPRSICLLIVGCLTIPSFAGITVIYVGENIGKVFNLIMKIFRPKIGTT